MEAALAVTAADDVLATVVDGRVPHDYALTDSRGLRIDRGWVSGETQGLMLSTLARLYDVTGERRWRRASHPVFDTLTAFRGFFAGSDPAPAYWTTSVDGAGYLWFDRFSKGLETSSVLSEQVWTGLGIYDYRRVLARSPQDRRASVRLFTGSLATLRHYLPRFRVPHRIWIDSLVAGNRNVRAHFVAEAQLALIERITASPGSSGRRAGPPGPAGAVLGGQADRPRARGRPRTPPCRRISAAPCPAGWISAGMRPSR